MRLPGSDHDLGEWRAHSDPIGRARRDAPRRFRDRDSVAGEDADDKCHSGRPRPRMDPLYSTGLSPKIV